MRLFVCALIVMLHAASAHADEEAARAEAAKLLDEGVALYSAKQYRESLDRFEKAYAAFASPKILFNIAGALEQLGREAEAAQTYDRFLAESSSDASAQDRVSASRQALAGLDRRLARLRVDPRPPAALTVDGLAVTVPEGRPIYVAPGRHAIQGTIDGATRTSTIDIAAGEERRVDLRRGEAVAASGVTFKTEKTHRVWTWVAGGAAVALLGGGVIAGRSADAAFVRYENARTIEEWEAERATTKQRATIANLCFVGAGVAAVSATLLFFFERSERQVMVTTASSGVGASLIGRF